MHFKAQSKILKDDRYYIICAYACILKESNNSWHTMPTHRSCEYFTNWIQLKNNLLEP